MLKLFLLPVLLYFHPVHVTLTTITQAEDSDTMKVFFRMYYDDFLSDYKLYDPGFKPEILSDGQSFPVDLLGKYFNDRVNIRINNKLTTGQVQELSFQDNEIFLTLLFRSEKYPRTMKIRNRVLTGVYDDQINMIFITVGRHEEAMRLTCDHSKEDVSFEK